MNRRNFFELVTATAASASVIGKPIRAEFKWLEATVSDLRRGMESGKVSSADLAKAYLRRIERMDRKGPAVNSVIEVNPDAMAIAREMDRERKAGKVRSPMHGIPVLLKDNTDTADKMLTTAGSLALMNCKPKRDAFLVRRLREAGAVILGKTNLSEWANFRSSRSTSGWSARGGLTRNPYALDRNTSGSSAGSGAAVAANFCSVAVGTETDGSIVSPSSYCGIVGLKPTVGLVSRSGVIPISKTQDTAGPMTRTVEDAAILLGAMGGVDDEDEVTRESREKTHKDYTQFLKRDGLRGARIGVARQYFRNRNEHSGRVIDEALKAMKDEGAELIDVEMPSFGKIGDAEFQVMLYEFKDGIERYLATRDGCPHKNLADLIAFNEKHAEKELAVFGQETFLRAQEKGSLRDKAYLEALEKCGKLSREEGIDAVMDEHKLDAIVVPSGGPAHRTDLVWGDRGTGGISSPAAVSGYPSITVPAGFVTELPLGISFFGRGYSEPTLLKIAYAFEQATRARRAPKFLETVDGISGA
ncbi:MAG TPA: amidase [Verrucomicrobiae bacterium]